MVFKHTRKTIFLTLEHPKCLQAPNTLRTTMLGDSLTWFCYSNIQTQVTCTTSQQHKTIVIHRTVNFVTQSNNINLDTQNKISKDKNSLLTTRDVVSVMMQCRVGLGIRTLCVFSARAEFYSQSDPSAVLHFSGWQFMCKKYCLQK